MPPLPTHLPDNIWGFLTAAFIVVGSLIMAMAKKSNQQKNSGADPTALAVSAMAEVWDDRIQKATQEAVAPLRADITGLEARVEIAEGKCSGWIVRERDWQRKHPATAPGDVIAPDIIADDIPGLG